MSTNYSNDRAIDSLVDLFGNGFDLHRLTSRWALVRDGQCCYLIDTRPIDRELVAHLADIQARADEANEVDESYNEFCRLIPCVRRDEDAPRRVLAAARKYLDQRDITSL